MKKAINNHAEKMKQNIDAVSKKSKETIHSIIGSTTKKFEEALDANKKFMESFEKQIFNKDFIDTSVISEVKKTFSSSVELSEEAIDTIIDIQSSQLQSAIDHNERLMETIRNLDFSNAEDREELLGALGKNFEESSNRVIENSKKMTDVYNKHINLAVNFNEKFSKNINSQLQMLSKFQNKNKETFNDWATKWWKNEEEVTA